MNNSPYVTVGPRTLTELPEEGFVFAFPMSQNRDIEAWCDKQTTGYWEMVNYGGHLEVGDFWTPIVECEEKNSQHHPAGSFFPVNAVYFRTKRDATIFKLWWR